MRWLLFVALTLLWGCSSSEPKTDLRKMEKRLPDKPPVNYKVTFNTTAGRIVLDIHHDWAPKGADHFFELLKAKFYDGVRFHRVVRKFIVQFGINGDPKIQQSWSALRIPDDPIKHKNTRGTISYAKIGANDRATQVFINLADNKILDKDHFVPFGEVVEGMDVVDKLYSVYGEVMPRGNGPDPTRMELEGNSYIERKFPRLDKINDASLYWLAAEVNH